MIELTVGLPMYKAKYIGWLSLESLCRQTRIDFEWELVVAEEQLKNRVGEKQVMTYASRLKEVGCSNIKYMSFSRWVPLANKWRRMVINSQNSLGFVTLAADCHISPNRLKNTYDIFLENNPSFIQTWYHNIYDLNTDTFYLFRNGYNSSAADMSIRMDVAKKLPKPPINKKRGIDGWLYKRSKDIEGNHFNVVYDESNAWNETMYVHGINYISKRNFSKKIYKKNKSKPNIPKDIMDRVKKCKKFINKEGYL